MYLAEFVHCTVVVESVLLHLILDFIQKSHKDVYQLYSSIFVKKFVRFNNKCV
jgi:hypothetical protein